MMCLGFVKCGTVYSGQTSQLWFGPSKGNCSRTLVVCSDVIMPTYAVLPCSFYDRRGFLLAVLTNGLYFFSFLRIVLSWTLTFNTPTYTCTVWDVAFGQFSEYYSIWSWGEFAESFTPGRIVALCYHTPDCSMPIKRSNVCFHSSARTCWWSIVHVISSIWQQLLNIVIPVKAAWKRPTTTNY